MKTSNKILLGAFLLCVLILTAIHVALYAKYKSGDFVYMKQLLPKNGGNAFKVPAEVNHVFINGLNNVIIIPSDTLSFAGVNSEYSSLYHKVSGDTLVLRYDSSGINKQEIPGNGVSVILYVPNGTHITGNYCSLLFNGAPDSTKAPSVTFNVYNSILTIGGSDTKTTSEYFNGLTINAEHESSLAFQTASSIKDLNVVLTNSIIEDTGAYFGRFSLSANNDSKVSLSVENLKKLTFTPKQ